jgi:hypothetical protein
MMLKLVDAYYRLLTCIVAYWRQLAELEGGSGSAVEVRVATRARQ